MSLHPIRAVRELLDDDVWRFALVAGGFSAWVVLSEALQTGSTTLEIEPVVAAGFLGGVLFATRSTKATTVGFRVGVVGMSVPVLWQSIELFRYIFGLSQPAWFGLVQAVFAVAAIGIFVGVGALVSAFAASVGNWVAGKFGCRPNPAGH
ncbi:DUF5518 domain-containing protein [Halogranum rubrum]|uniref:Uncharacterized protein n=1 Tax=Halogranum salarium B-1 TaxID=1210908 RepID=J2ZKT3_9EURY|nr:DUF5518 domain-containing protein [Halogranum salarium]EJN61330.1 hypothetical protein HSB1_03710 [Halogranum salarium B-1]